MYKHFHIRILVCRSEDSERLHDETMRRTIYKHLIATGLNGCTATELYCLTSVCIFCNLHKLWFIIVIIFSFSQHRPSLLLSNI